MNSNGYDQIDAASTSPFAFIIRHNRLFRKWTKLAQFEVVSAELKLFQWSIFEMIEGNQM